MTATPIQAVLEAIKADLATVDGVKAAKVWEGGWEALESHKQVSLPAPAVLVSLIEFEVVHLGQTIAARGQLTASPAPTPPSPLRQDGAVRATVEAEIAVTVLAASPDAGKRAETALDVATRAVPVLVSHALLDVGGANLDSPKLRERGLSAFVLVGRREICLAPPGGDRQTPTRVDAADAGGGRTIAWRGNG